MRVDGKTIADNLLAGLAAKVSALSERGSVPTLAVILVGNNPASLAYIRQKQKAADTIGARVIFDHQPDTITPSDLAALVTTYNADPSVSGLIIQRPVPETLGDVSAILSSVAREKDVDGFLSGSSFDVPVAAATGEILSAIHSQTGDKTPFPNWLRSKRVAVIGRGDTAGEPIFRYFTAHGCTTTQIHSGTPDPAVTTRQADIVISCVGKERIITADAVKPGGILIGVGIWRDKTGKLRGDYDEDEIDAVAAYYTPTPRGVGPVNVACLMQNLVKACTLHIEHKSA